jgi:hypothetical protein
MDHVLNDTALKALVAWQLVKLGVRDRLTDEHGEGVISTAIAVLIMALIGLLMWTVFQRVFNDAGTRIESNVNDIG